MFRIATLGVALAASAACIEVKDSGDTGLGGGVWGTGHVSMTASDGRSGQVDDPDGAEGPGFTHSDGGLEQGIVSISAGLGEDYIDISLLPASSLDQGIQAGDTCHVFAELDLSTGGCGWFELGAGTITGSDGAPLYETNAWDSVSGTLTVSELTSDADGVTLSFDFSVDVTQGAVTATVQGSVVDARVN